ncbi:MAG: NADPH:quinone oxidoreductase family protein [Betaproteobacteria bacterium]|nr:NADPH:quinone oxidoreductase family protein [Betaproteobacteria bacterium]
MRALIVTEHGPLEKLNYGEFPDPTPGKGEVLIDVHAASVNFPDLLVIGGSYQNLPPRPFVPGKDLAGVVAAVGEGVTRMKAGDRVVAQIEHGAFAERAVVREVLCFVMPAKMPFEEGAAMGLVYLTAHNALIERANFKAGETVLVTGAAGGVGLACVQLAKALGATVVAAVSSEEKARIAREAGADHVVRTDVADLRENFRKQVFDALNKTEGKRGVDLALENVGGDVFDASLRVLAWCGRLVIIGFAGGRIPEVKAGYLLVKNISLIGLQSSDYRERTPDVVRRAYEHLFALYERGKLKPRVMAAYPFKDYLKALHMVQDRKVLGKVVVMMRD